MTAPITVITVSIPSRRELLQQNIASVYEQTVSVERQLICTHASTTDRDYRQIQYSTAKNDLLAQVTTPWVAVLNDDDYWQPHHVETILSHLDNADIVYTWEANNHKPREDCNSYSQQQLIEIFDRTNFLDANCAIRTSKLREVGGFPVDLVNGRYGNGPARWEDWQLWRLMARADARFHCVPEPTWCYGLGTPEQICG